MIEITDAKWNADGSITCKFNHPTFGWIPTTVSDSDAQTRDIFAAAALSPDITPYNPQDHAPTMAEEIATCGAQFKYDMNILQLRWLAAAVTNGTSAAAKKLAVEEDIVEAKAKYALDIAEIKSRCNI